MGTTAAQKKLFFNLRRMKSKMQAIEEGDLKPEDVNYIATQLAVTNDEVISMNRRLSGPDASLNVRVGEDGGGEWQDWLASDDESAETEYAEREEHDERMILLNQALSTLNEREQHIIRERRLRDDPVTLEDLADQYGVSRERIRQIEVRAFEKMQAAIKKAALESGLIAA
jgi:RNA polymerase sigma-32 factor